MHCLIVDINGKVVTQLTAVSMVYVDVFGVLRCITRIYIQDPRDFVRFQPTIQWDKSDKPLNLPDEILSVIVKAAL